MELLWHQDESISAEKHIVYKLLECTRTLQVDLFCHIVQFQFLLKR